MGVLPIIPIMEHDMEHWRQVKGHCHPMGVDAPMHVVWYALIGYQGLYAHQAT